MSGIELKPIGESGRTNILLPLGKTTIGRGSFFGVADKRVSRNHAILEVDDGTVTVMPIHTNPTFFRNKGGTKMTALPKDKLHTLKNGDRIALTPDEHIFEIVVDERPIVPETLSPRRSVGDTSPMKRTTPQQQKAQDNGKKDSEEEEDENVDTRGKAEGEDDGDVEPKPTEQDKRTPSVTDDDDMEHKDDEEESKNGDGHHGKKEEEEDEKEEEAEEEKADEAQPSIQKRGRVKTVVLDGNKEVALPVQRARNLPEWMMNVPKTKTPAAEPKTTTTTAATAKAATPAKKGRGKGTAKQESDTRKTMEKRGRGRPKGTGKASAAERRTPAKAKSSSRDYGDDDDEDVYYDDDDDDEPAPKKTKLSRSQRGSTKVASYAEDDYDDLDDDWVADEMDVDDDGSDWEMDSQSKKGKGKGKHGKSPKGKRISPRKRGRPKKYKDVSDDEDDFSEEEVYVPRPTKRTSIKNPGSKGHDVSDEDEDEDEKEEYKPRPTKRTVEMKKTSEKVKRRKEIDISDEDEEEEDDSPQKKTNKKKKKLKSCEFGKRCYRKTQAHFDKFCHPGDPDYNSNSDENANGDDDDDDRQECEYGTSCYRKNAEHRKQYKHTKAPGRPRREVTKKGKKKSILAGDGDDKSAPNTYDYDDSFLNEDDSESPFDPASADSDWGPDEENSEDVRNLVKEAKGFVKNRKMYKT